MLKQQQSSMLEELEECFFMENLSVSSKMVKGSEYITIQMPANKVAKGFAMVGLGGHHLRAIQKVIEGTHFINSITTVLHDKKLATEILICSNSAKENNEN